MLYSRSLRLLELLILCALTISSVARAEFAPPGSAQVLPGIDVLARNNFAQLKGKRVGLVINQTAVRRDPRQRTLDAFLATDQCRVTALFAPEHGIDGAVLAGESVGNQIEPKSGLTVYSLYGATKKPTRQMMRDVDVMVYDIQDIGVRSYTYISTLIKVMEGCADARIPLVVLDRPNPLGGEIVDGPVLDPDFKSFVGIVPIPYVYGLTAGELALMANAEGWLEGGKPCALSIVRVEGWNRLMTWRETGLQWIPPSPHVPTPESAFANAVTGAIGELSVVSIGIGYTLPFELIGATWLEANSFSARLNALNIAGIYFRPITYKPFYGMSNGAICQGSQVVRIPGTPAPFTAAVAILTTLRDDYPEKKLFEGVAEDRWKMFDKICGTDRIRLDLMAGASLESIVSAWQSRLHQYISKRESYLLYE